MSKANKQPKISTKVKSSDWRNLEIERWNVATFTAFITETTREKYGVEYQPGGQGSKSARWAMERGMLKQAQGTYGNATLRKFIELCWGEYRPNAEYPYATFTLMNGWMDRNYAKAQSEVAREKRAQAVPTQDIEDLAKWL